MIIDFHTHIFPPQIKRKRSHYLKRDPSFAELYSNPKAKLATAEELIESMERDGVDCSVVLNIGWSSHELCRESNDYIIESISKYPKRLIGFCAIQPREGERAIAELERCVATGIRGIGEMRCDAQGFDLGDREFMRPIAEVAEKYGLIILSHSSEPVGHPYPGKGAITPDILYRFIANFPKLRIVLAHWGGGLPFYALMPEVAESLRNAYFDTAASPFLYRDEVFGQVAGLVGASKILFGSDYPLMPQMRIVERVRALNMPQGVKDGILGGNAQRILGLI